MVGVLILQKWQMLQMSSDTFTSIPLIPIQMNHLEAAVLQQAMIFSFHIQNGLILTDT